MSCFPEAWALFFTNPCTHTTWHGQIQIGPNPTRHEHLQPLLCRQNNVSTSVILLYLLTILILFERLTRAAVSLSGRHSVHLFWFDVGMNAHRCRFEVICALCNTHILKTQQDTTWLRTPLVASMQQHVTVVNLTTVRHRTSSKQDDIHAFYHD